MKNTFQIQYEQKVKAIVTVSITAFNKYIDEDKLDEILEELTTLLNENLRKSNVAIKNFNIAVAEGKPRNFIFELLLIATPPNFDSQWIIQPFEEKEIIYKSIEITTDSKETFLLQ